MCIHSFYWLEFEVDLATELAADATLGKVVYDYLTIATDVLIVSQFVEASSKVWMCTI